MLLLSVTMCLRSGLVVYHAWAGRR